jgi:hypothetical protein
MDQMAGAQFQTGETIFLFDTMATLFIPPPHRQLPDVHVTMLSFMPPGTVSNHHDSYPPGKEESKEGKGIKQSCPCG